MEGVAYEGAVGHSWRRHDVVLCTQRRRFSMKLSQIILTSLAVCMLAVVGCGDDDKSPSGPEESALLGTWLDDDEPGEQITFHSGGTFTEIDDDEESTGTWRLRGDNLTLTYEDLKIGDLIGDLSISFEIEISGNSMTITWDCDSIEADGGLVELAAGFVEFCEMAPKNTWTKQG